MSDTKTLLEEKDIPKAWYNIIPDLPVPLPPILHPGTKKPVGPDDLSPTEDSLRVQQRVDRCYQKR